MNFLQKYINKVVFALNTNKIAICKQTFVPGQTKPIKFFKPWPPRKRYISDVATFSVEL